MGAAMMQRKLIYTHHTTVRVEGIFSRSANRLPPTQRQRHTLQRLSRAIDIVSENDRIWFQQHPARCLRLRAISKAEKEWSSVFDEHDHNYVIVEQMRPGMRSRHMISAFLLIDPDDAD